MYVASCRTERFIVVIVAALVLAAAFQSPLLAQNIGVISGTVVKGDSPRGLTVRSEPSDKADPLGFLPDGAPIKGSTDVRNGFVRLKEPLDRGWVPLDLLKPTGGEGTVTGIDRPELCLRIRKGPSTAFEIIGCAELSKKLKLNGRWSANNWAQLEEGGWVFAGQISSDLKLTAQARGRGAGSSGYVSREWSGSSSSGDAVITDGGGGVISTGSSGSSYGGWGIGLSGGGGGHHHGHHHGGHHGGGHGGGRGGGHK
jgi:hypothetical protein